METIKRSAFSILLIPIPQCIVVSAQGGAVTLKKQIERLRQSPIMLAIEKKFHTPRDTLKNYQEEIAKKENKKIELLQRKENKKKGLDFIEKEKYFNQKLHEMELRQAALQNMDEQIKIKKEQERKSLEEKKRIALLKKKQEELERQKIERIEEKLQQQFANNTVITSSQSDEPRPKSVATLNRMRSSLEDKLPQGTNEWEVEREKERQAQMIKQKALLLEEKQRHAGRKLRMGLDRFKPIQKDWDPNPKTQDVEIRQLPLEFLVNLPKKKQIMSEDDWKEVDNIEKRRERKNNIMEKLRSSQQLDFNQQAQRRQIDINTKLMDDLKGSPGFVNLRNSLPTHLQYQFDSSQSIYKDENDGPSEYIQNQYQTKFPTSLAHRKILSRINKRSNSTEFRNKDDIEDETKNEKHRQISNSYVDDQFNWANSIRKKVGINVNVNRIGRVGQSSSMLPVIGSNSEASHYEFHQ
ncbi:MAG: hypothetical protein EZS28_005894 [Streblomastix strix]|uniref:Trichohyalin-plectin-homology domain-containing protein n=1 Tax=Streblomastix strix TaxID=222440 RepID=A0A5J4WVR7_9EUKA|nr:MAG: hypothetical protein EZS28_005894 [Streblomastix strix]